MEQPPDGGGCLRDELLLQESNSAPSGSQSRSRVRDLGAKPGCIAIRGVSRSRSFGPGICSRYPHASFPKQGAFISPGRKSKSLSRLFSDRRLDQEQCHGGPTCRKGFKCRSLFSETSYRLKNNNSSLTERYNSPKKINEYLKENRRLPQSNSNDIPSSSDADAQENPTLVTLVGSKFSSDTHNRNISNINKELRDIRSRLFASHSSSFTISVREPSDHVIGGNTDDLPRKNREKHECDLPDNESFSCIMKKVSIPDSISSTSNYLDLTVPRNNTGSTNSQGNKFENVTYTSSSPVLNSFFGSDHAQTTISAKAKRDSFVTQENSRPRTTPEHHNMKPISGKLRALKLKYYIKHDLLSPLRTRQLEIKQCAEKDIVYNPYYTFLPEFTSSSTSLTECKHEKCATSSSGVNAIRQSALSLSANQRPRSKSSQCGTSNTQKEFKKGSRPDSGYLEKIYPTSLATCINYFQQDSVINNCEEKSDEFCPYFSIIRAWAHLQDAKQHRGEWKFDEKSLNKSSELDGTPENTSTVLERHSGAQIPLSDIIAKKVYSRIPCRSTSAKKDREQGESDLEKAVHSTHSETDSSSYSLAQSEMEEKGNIEIINENHPQNERQTFADISHHPREDERFFKETTHTTDCCTTNISQAKKSDIREESGIRPIPDKHKIEKFPSEKSSIGVPPTDLPNCENKKEYDPEKTSLEEQRFFSSLLSSQDSFFAKIRSSQYIGCPYCNSSTVLDDEMESKFNEELEQYSKHIKRQLSAGKSKESVKSSPDSNELRSVLESDLPQDADVQHREDRKMHSRHGLDKSEADVGGETWTARKEKESYKLQSPPASDQCNINSTHVLSQLTLSHTTSTEENLQASSRLAGLPKIKRGGSPKKSRHTVLPNTVSRNEKSPKSYSIAPKQFREKCRQSWSQSTESSIKDLEKEGLTDSGEGLYKKNGKIQKRQGDKVASLRSFSIDTLSNRSNAADSPLVFFSWDESAKCDSKSLQDNKRSYSLLYWNQSSSEPKCTKHEFKTLIKRLISTISSSVLQIKASNSAPNCDFRCHSAPHTFTASTNCSTYLRNKDDSLVKIDVPKLHNQSPTADTTSNVVQNNISDEIQARVLEAKRCRKSYDAQCENQISREENIICTNSLNENKLSNTSKEEEFIKNTLLEMKHSIKSDNEKKSKELLFHTLDVQKENDETHSSTKREDLIQQSLQCFKRNDLGSDQNQHNEYFHLLSTDSTIPCYFKQISQASSSREWNLSIEYPAIPVKRSAFSWWKHKQKTIDTFSKLFDTLGVFYLATSDEEISTDDEFDAISWHD